MQVDAVVIDCQMPHMSGAEMAHRIRNDQRFDGLAIILMTAQDIAACEKTVAGIRIDQTMQAVSALDVSLEDKLDLITVVDEYVFGFCQHQRTNFRDESFGVASPALIRYVEDLAATGDYPHIAALLAEHGSAEAWAKITAHAMDLDRFDRSLARILDGFEASFRGRHHR